jgi:hypothetical protein
VLHTHTPHGMLLPSDSTTLSQSTCCKGARWGQRIRGRGAGGRGRWRGQVAGAGGRGRWQGQVAGADGRSGQA